MSLNRFFDTSDSDNEIMALLYKSAAIKRSAPKLDFFGTFLV